MKCRIFIVSLYALLFFFQAATVQGDGEPVRILGRAMAERGGAGQEMKDLRKYVMQTEYQRALGNIAGFDVTVKTGTVRFKHPLSDWLVEFTTLLPNLTPGGPGNRRGIDLY